jgi:hypothetical protein
MLRSWRKDENYGDYGEEECLCLDVGGGLYFPDMDMPSRECTRSASYAQQG